MDGESYKQREMNKVYTYIDYCDGMNRRFRGISGCLVPDAPTTKQTLTVLTIRRTKHFCPDVMRVIAKHLWTMREYDGSDARIILCTERSEYGFGDICTFIREHCSKLDQHDDHVFLNDESITYTRMYIAIKSVYTDAVIKGVDYDSRNRMSWGTLCRPTVEILTWLINHIKDNK